MSRNPIALGMILTFLGLFLLAPSFIVFTGFLIFTVNMHFRILLEEDFMRQQFGHEYEEYLRRTRRYL
jgi:protein-S-isoprenylcysteine O-methyltransferase Ste14